MAFMPATLAKAEAGDAKAQYHLGLMYRSGHFMERTQWFALAAVHGEPVAFLNREALGPLMTSKQITDARKRVEDFVPKKNPPKD